MVKIIETNLLLDDNNKITDFQSRVIEMKSWSDYIDEYNNPKYTDLEDCVGNLNGAILLRGMKVAYLEYDDCTLSCDCVYEYLDIKINNLKKAQKIAYLVH